VAPPSRRRNEEARKLEKQLVIQLDRIVNEIKRSGVKDISLLQRQHNTQIQHVLRSAIEKAYVLAAEKAVNTRRQHPQRRIKQAAALSDLTRHFTTAIDLNNIGDKVQEYMGIFWRRMNVFLHQNDVQPNPTGFSPQSKYNVNSLVTSMGTSAITDTMSDATTSKLDQLGDPNEKVKWVTQHDERVCPICNELDGRIWSIDDPSLQSPPDDTHENCRCELEPVTSAGGGEEEEAG